MITELTTIQNLGILKIDNTGTIKKFNEYAKQFFNVSSSLVGERIVELMPEYSLEDFYFNNRNYSIRVLYSLDIFTCSYFEIDKDGFYITIVFAKNEELYNYIKNTVESRPLDNATGPIYEISKKDSPNHEPNLDFHGIISVSKKMQDIFSLIVKISNTSANILITGETGVGKNLIARYIHNASKLNASPFVDINCGTIHSNLIESELFGYERGSFTGAVKEGKKGKIEIANKGTLFLDEVAEMSLDTQKSLLQVIQEKRFTRVGGIKYTYVDFRLITATNKNLLELVDKGLFREDLFYRLNVIPIHIPPLRERPDDIIPLALYFLSKYNECYDKNKVFSKETKKILYNYFWPGNVRELENLIERLVITSSNRYIEISDLPQNMIESIDKYKQTEIINLKSMLESYEKMIIIDAYKKYKTSTKVGKALGISQTTAARKIRTYLQDKKK